MGKPKLVKFEELKSMPNVFDKDGAMKGKWRNEFFKNESKITLELACGKGDYTRGLAVQFPEENFIGMDLKGNRIWTGTTLADKAGLKNVAFIRDQIDHLDTYFEAGEVDEIWITFPDPYLRESKSKKRLTSPKFLEVYRPILKKGGLVNLKTDNDVLYNFTLEVIEEQGLEIIHNYKDIYEAGVSHLTHEIQTHYEGMHLKNDLTIKYICFKIHSTN